VVGVDGVPSRRALAQRFGVDLAVDPRDAAVAASGADAVIEVCGDASVIGAGIDWLRVGGRYVLAGVVNPGSMATVDANLILRKLLTLTGVHNYHPRHLPQALAFVVANRDRFPFRELVDGRYGLADVGRAMDDAAAHRVLRAAIAP
jgi:threonine dehydrogenase-like Zn-dependent dehydrogenase